VLESILSYGCEIWIMDYMLKTRPLSTEMDFWRRAAGISRILKVRTEVTRQRMGVIKQF
jgi:hypothetical protein